MGKPPVRIFLSVVFCFVSVHPLDIALPKTTKGDQVRKMFIDPSGTHAFISCESKLNYYYLCSKRKLVPLNKPKNSYIESVAWNRVQSTTENTGNVLLGLADGSIYIISLENEKEKVSKKIWQLPGGSIDTPICGITLDLFPGISISDEESFKWYVLVATPQIHYQFIGGPSLEMVFSKDLKNMHHLPGESKKGELHVFRSFGEPRILAHLTGAGIYIANIDLSGHSAPGSSLISKGWTHNYSELKVGQPLSIQLTEFHVLLMFDNQLIAVNHLSNEVVHSRTFTSTTGKLKGLCKDEKNDMLWLFSENLVFELRLVNEDRDVWRILLQKQQFREALNYCNAAQREVVLYSYSNALFEKKQYEEAAEILSLSSRTFEEVALKFIQHGATAALKRYLLSKLEKYIDADQDGKGIKYKTQRIMISTWLVEIFLDQINSIKGTASFHEDHKKVIEEFHFFLKNFKKHIHAETAFVLISSHGLEDEMMFFAELIGDYDRMISYHIGQCEYLRAVSVLNSLQEHIDPKAVDDLFYKYVPLLFNYEPRACVDSMILIRTLDPARFLPTLMRYDISRNQPGDNEHHAIRYIEYSLKKKSQKDPALYNYLISLYVKLPKEDRILDFIINQDHVNPPYDMKYALRSCHQEGKKRACVFLYSYMELYTDAVKLALSIDDLELAKEMADLPDENYSDKKKLWLLIGSHVVQKEKSTEKAIAILKECKDLQIEDILPLFPDDVRIGDFKDEISRALSKYTDDIAALKNEMNEYTATADRIRKDIQKLKNRHGEIPASRTCDLCHKPVLLRHFYLFPCSHAIHVDCAEAFVRKHVSLFPRKIDYFNRDNEMGMEDLGGVLSSLGLTIAVSKADVADFSGAIDRSNIKDLARAECIFCGDLMIESVRMPFIRYDEEENEVKSWMA